MRKILYSLVALVGLSVVSEATVAISTASPSGVVLIAAPSSGKTRIKSITVSNDLLPALNTCVQFKDGSTLKLQVCAPAQQTALWPTNAQVVPGITGQTAVDNFLGEGLLISGAFNVFSSTPNGTANTGIQVTVSYDTTRGN